MAKDRKDPWMYLMFISCTERPRADFFLALLKLFEEYEE
jgi:hypothetical protein